MSSILVTGGMGVIGSWVTRQLVEQGESVITYQRSPQTLLLKDIMDKFTFVAGDVQDLPRLIHTIKQYRVERVIHMAGLGTPPLEANPYMGYKINVDGAINIFEAARLSGVKRVVAASSKAVYGTIKGEFGHPTYRPVDEDYPRNPVTVYGAAKLFLENMGINYNRIYGLDFIAVRFGSTYGPGKQTRHGNAGESGATSHIKECRIIEAGMLGRSLKMPGGGDQVNDMVYHRDVANGIVRACFAENPEHRAFQIATGKGETLKHLAEIVNKMFPEANIEVGAGMGGPLEVCSILSIDRAKKELGYSPKYDLEAGVKDYVDTMRRLDIKPIVLP